MNVKNICMLLCVLSLVFSISSACFAFEGVPSSARSLALGGVKTTLVGPGLESAMLGNPAGMSLNKSGILIHYNNRFGFSDYTNKNISLFWNTTKLGMGFTYQNNGVMFHEQWQGNDQNNFWGERRLGLGLGTNLKGLKFGFNLWKNEEVVEMEEDLSWLGNLEDGFVADFGFLYKGGKWGGGFVYKNWSLTDSQITEPEINLGLRIGEEGYLAAFADLNMSRDSVGEFEVDTHCGVEAWLSKELAIRIGLDSAQMITAGLGINKGRMQLDYAYRTHPAGISHYLTTGFSF